MNERVISKYAKAWAKELSERLTKENETKFMVFTYPSRVISLEYLPGSILWFLWGLGRDFNPHIFFECNGFTTIWKIELFDFNSQHVTPNFRARLLSMWNTLDVDDFALACVVIWKLWDVCNQILHEDVRFLASNVIKWIMNLLEVFHPANMSSSTLAAAIFPTQWVSPLRTWSS